MSAEKILEYYIKLAKKETKVRKVYIQQSGIYADIRRWFAILHWR